MKSYLELAKQLIDKGRYDFNERTGKGVYVDTGYVWKHRMSEGFPLLTTKKMMFENIVDELLWMISGDTNTKTLNSKIWDQWADENGELGPIYGHQWRNFFGIDQIKVLKEKLKANPSDRRLLVTAWNPAQLDEMKLPPCHFAWKIDKVGDKFHGSFFKRSTDFCVGLPWNFAFYTLLFQMIVGDKLEQVNAMLTNLHIYEDHIPGLQKQFTREPKKLPTVKVNFKDDIDAYTKEDFTIDNYEHDKFIKFEVAK